MEVAVGVFGQCGACLGWGPLGGYGACEGCDWFRRRVAEQAVCSRCRHPAHVDGEGICRGCRQAVRLDDDLEWVMVPQECGPRHRQLLLTPGRAWSANALPVSRTSRASRQAMERRTKPSSVSDGDDPAVLPAVVPGQGVLLTLKRTLTCDMPHRIRARPLRGYEQALPQAAAFAAERGLSEAWVRQVAGMLRLALAVRDADGTALVSAQALDELPQLRFAVEQILARAGMLWARDAPSTRRVMGRPVAYADVLPPPPEPRPRSCLDCDAWMVRKNGRRCRPCQAWRTAPQRIAGVCRRCARGGLPLKNGWCRGCCLHVLLQGQRAAAEPFTQLWITDPLPLGLRRRRGELGYQPASTTPGRTG